MEIDSKTIKEIYEGKIAKSYDRSMSHFFASFKKKAIQDSSLMNGDRVVVFCCGTGLDFPPILERVGNRGQIIGIDFSAQMLRLAKEKVQKFKWNNVDLIQADVTVFYSQLKQKADTGVCTLGLSIIPDFKKAYYNLISNVKENGEIIIGDMQLATGWQARLNPLTVFLSRKFGGSFDGNKNSLEISSMMNEELFNVKKKHFFLGAYYYCIGRKKSESIPSNYK